MRPSPKIHPGGPQGLAHGPRGPKIKSENPSFFIKAKDKMFWLMQLFAPTQPWSPRALGKSGKSPSLTGLLNEKLEFWLGA